MIMLRSDKKLLRAPKELADLFGFPEIGHSVGNRIAPAGFEESPRRSAP
jgi:hypothetical protein